MTQVLQCDTHGLIPWAGHVVCDRCGTVFQTTDPKGLRFAPPICCCGVRLMPSLRRGIPHSARYICQACYEEHMKPEEETS